MLIKQFEGAKTIHEITRTDTKFLLVPFRVISWIVSHAPFGKGSDQIMTLMKRNDV